MGIDLSHWLLARCPTLLVGMLAGGLARVSDVVGGGVGILGGTNVVGLRMGGCWFLAVGCWFSAVLWLLLSVSC